jgi:hypothetical protein
MQTAEVWAARFRQEDGFRDHKRRLEMEECRTWTKEPILRTFQAQLAALTLLPILQGRLDHAWHTGSLWAKPEWNRHKRHASILDLCRLVWRSRPEFSQFLVASGVFEIIPQPIHLGQDLTGGAV